MLIRIISLLLLLSPLMAFCQINSLNELPRRVAGLVKISVTIEMMDSSLDIDKRKPKVIGSGFLLVKSNKNYVITNAHVAKAPAGKEKNVIGINLETIKVYGIINLLKIDEQKDIAIYTFNRNVLKPKNIPDSLLHWTQSNIGISMFAKNDEIKPGNTVVSIGYPLAIGATTDKNSPVVRMSIVAQEIQPNGVFLIDGASNPGNSGSPVFSIFSDKLVGMIFSGPMDMINLYDSEGRHVANLPYNAGLTYCISAEEILKLLP